MAHDGLGVESIGTFGELVKHLRQRARLTQQEFGLAVGYSRAHVARLENGQRSPDLAIVRARFADALGLQKEPELAKRLIELAITSREGTTSESPSKLESTSTTPSVHNNLPPMLAHFIGRERELDEVKRLLAGQRLLTLTGAGGAGKTRLAQRAAHGALSMYPDGAYYVELAVVTDPAQIPTAAARALGIVPGSDSARQQVIDFLSTRESLLVLDNCEHLIDAAASFAFDVLRGCPDVSILATSRERLNVEGEATWRVPPMQPSEAMQLFIERASRVQAAFTEDDRAMIAHLCERLDGMPLAIELAAARLSGLRLADLVKRLDNRFALLTGGRRDALPRQQTLRATIDWSHDLLTEPERVVFRRLSVFIGGWTAELAEQTCSGEGVAIGDVLPLLISLADKSLVSVEHYDDETRYRYLETIREYAMEKLAACGEHDALLRRYAEAYAVLAEQSEIKLHSREQRRVMIRLERDYPNINAALTWAFSVSGDARIGCQIFGCLEFFWNLSGHGPDMERWSKQAMSAINAHSPARICGRVWELHTKIHAAYLGTHATLDGLYRALAYYIEAADLVCIVGTRVQIAMAILQLNTRDPEGWRMLEECVAAGRSIGDMRCEHSALKGLAMYTLCLGDTDRAEALLEENMRLCRETEDYDNLGGVLMEYAGLRLCTRQFRSALALAEETVVVGQQVADFAAQVYGHLFIADSSRFLGDLPRAQLAAEKALDIAEARWPKIEQVPALNTIAKIHIASGQYVRAQAVLDDAMRIAFTWTPNFPEGPYSALYNTYACLAVCQKQYRRAALLFGVADAELGAVRGVRPPMVEVEIGEAVAAARAAMSADAFDAARAEGQVMSRPDAVALSLRENQR